MKQPDLFPPATPPARRPAPLTPHDFIPGPECDPRPGVAVPEWLKLPTDEPVDAPIAPI